MAGRERDEDSFLSRWSERKREAKQNQDERPDAVTEDAAARSGALTDAAAEPADAEAEAFNPEHLPDIETLDKDADFSVFMHKKVPDALRRRALRRLWKVDPTFAFRDGMNDYDEDYTDAAMVVEGLKTAYQVGKGMVSPEEPDEDEAPEEDTEVIAKEDAGEPAGTSDAEEELQKADREISDFDGFTEDQPAPKTSAEAESTPGTPAEEPSSRPSGSALRRRWGDQTA